MLLKNPILPGFHPDPSICRAGEWFYIATSTFHWFPGVRIHKSKDLVNWELCPSPLTRKSQLDMRGVPDSGGIWAPCLSYTEPQSGKPGKYWLIYTNVRSLGNGQSDFPNSLVTAEAIDGPWSEPISLNASGFDPSMFHDDDGKHWLVNMVFDHRTDRSSFGGILLQEYDHDQQRLVGKPRNIFKGTELDSTEAPHLYKRDGLYYLMTAEGGTFWDHAVTVARSKNIEGPYEVDPTNPILTSRHNPSLPIQKAGHASLVEGPNGQWVLVHLAGRPIGEHRRCLLGRETCIQPVVWSDDGWIRLASGRHTPEAEVTLDIPAADNSRARATRERFDNGAISPDLQSLRVPMDPSWISTTDRPGYCRIYGRDGLFSLFDQSLIARRVQAFRCMAETTVEFAPETFQHMAGLIAYYDTRDWFYAHITADDNGNKLLRLSSSTEGNYKDAICPDVALPKDESVDIRCVIESETLRFRYRVGADWHELGPELDATVLSDDFGVGWDHFTGAFIGICCQDLTGQKHHADFGRFEYAEL